MSLKTLILLVCLVSPLVVIGKPQISFGEEESSAVVEANSDTKPVEETVVEPISSGDDDLDNELIHTRLGLLAGYLSKSYFSDFIF